MLEFIANGTWGFCFWDLPAFLLLVTIGVITFVQQRRHKNRMRLLQAQLDEQLQL